MRFTFDLFHGDESPSKDFVGWVPEWWYRSVGLPLQKGVFPSGDEWLLAGWFLSDENPWEIISRFRSTGIETLFKADGQFILVLYSKSDDFLEIFRDWTGIFPLVYAQGKDTIGISTCIENVVNFAKAKPSVSPALLHQYPVYRITFVPDTSIHGIKTLCGRHSLRITGTHIETVEHPLPVSAGPRYQSLEEAACDLGENLSRSVKQRLRHCKNLGAWLSGGNDSSLLVGLARGHYEGPIKTVFVTFEDYSRNYSEDARRVSKQFETEHLEVVVSPNEYLNHWAETIQSIESPLRSPGVIGQVVAFKALSGKVDSILDGEGADSVFGGPYWPFTILLSNTANIIPSGLRKLFNEISKKMKGKTFLSKSIIKSLKALGTPLREYVLSALTIGDEDTVNSVFREETWKQTIHNLQRSIGRDPLGEVIFFLMLNFVRTNVEAIIRLGFKREIIPLFPYLAHELIQSSLRLPVHLRYHYTTKKAALKVYARNFFDREFIHKPKEGLGAPLGKWFTRPEFEPFLNLPLEERSLKRGWWEEKELRKIIESHRAGSGDDHTAESIPWITVNLELWARVCLENDSPDLYKI
jgi:asparagine synthase (glutamine-hydrolysing)